MPETTCVPGCSWKGRHVFPCDVSRRKTWVHAIKGEKTSLKAGHSYICENHFIADDYNTPYGQS